LKRNIIAAKVIGFISVIPETEESKSGFEIVCNNAASAAATSITAYPKKDEFAS